MKTRLASTLALGLGAAGLVGLSSAPAQAAGFRSCAAVRAAGIQTPIPFGHPNYQANLDRDNDGWACEPPGVTLPDPRKAPQPTKPAPAPAKPGPVVVKPAQPAPATGTAAHPAQPGAPATGPAVQTDYVTSGADGAATVLGAFALIGGITAAGAVGVRAAKR